ncbi:MAG TPA: YihY/virulence factor BrkB family protein [Actinomycetes bacterium]|jgi:membrane protein|nr:YihY/virulence factor BrkB family protein [Actinomycetes bacterium]
MSNVMRTTKLRRRGGGRRLARLGVLGAAVLVGRKTASRQNHGSNGRSGPNGVPGRADTKQSPSVDANDPWAGHSPKPPATDGRGRGAESPQDIPKQGWRDILIRVKNEIRDDKVPLISAGVAYYALLSLFPAIIALVSVYGLVADPGDVRAQVNNLASIIPEGSRTLITDQLTALTSTAGAGLSLGAAFGILTALWSASSGMKALITGINIAYGEPESRKFLKLRGLALLLTLGAILTMAIALGVIVVLPVLIDHVFGPVGGTVVGILRWPFLALLMIVGLAVLYRLAPDRDDPKWRWVTPGSVVATVLWVLASMGFSFYASHFGNYSKTYGSLGAVVILLFWLYLSAFVVLVGAEVNAEMELQTKKDTTHGPDKPMGERDAHAADHVAETPATVKG